MRAVARAIGVLLGLAATNAQAAALVADLSSDRIAITSSFSGTELLLFGALEAAGDVVVVVRGPRREMIVHRRERIAGIWVKRHPVSFADAPGFYALATSTSLAAIGAEEFFREHRIGLDNLELKQFSTMSADTIGRYGDALVRDMRRRGLYSDQPGEVRLLEGRLFRTTIDFPADVPVGSYDAEVYVFRDGALIAARSIPLRINKTGLEAALYDFAYDYAALYGICAIAIALFAGWFASVIFRRA